MDAQQQTVIDAATWPAKEPGNVMMCWRRGLAVEVAEEETNALLEQAISPKFLPLSFGFNRVRLTPHERGEWAYRALATLRNERLDGDRI